jgi:hypothetical protein
VQFQTDPAQCADQRYAPDPLADDSFHV